MPVNTDYFETLALVLAFLAAVMIGVVMAHRRTSE
jgi:hypothetical protein